MRLDLQFHVQQSQGKGQLVDQGDQCPFSLQQDMTHIITHFYNFIPQRSHECHRLGHRKNGCEQPTVMVWEQLFKRRFESTTLSCNSITMRRSTTPMSHSLSLWIRRVANLLPVIGANANGNKLDRVSCLEQ